VITSFTVSPETITQGKNSTLSWKVSGATTVSIDKGVGDVTDSSSALTTPYETTVYTLTARNSVGASVTAQARVMVVPPLAITSFVAIPTPIEIGKSSTLQATFTNGTGVIDTEIGVVKSGDTSSTGPLSVNTTYTLTVTNPAGDSEKVKVTVTVARPGSFASVGTIKSRRNHTATLLKNGKVLITGGDSYGLPDGSPVAELYDPVTRTFKATGSMTRGRESHAATLLANGKVLISGGAIGNGDAFTSAELYDPVTETFTATGSMTSPRYLHTGTLLGDGRVLIAAGHNGDATLLKSAELYDPTSQTFTAVSSESEMSNSRQHHIAMWLSALGKALVVSGNGAQNYELFDPAKNVFSTVGRTITSRWFAKATLLTNGNVLMVGGGAAGDENLASAEVYDPASQTSVATGSMTTPRWLHSCTTMDNGQVLIAGGLDKEYLTSAELYDPKTGTFKVTGSMVSQRHDHTATALPDRTVLIVGGNVDSSGPGAELYFY
jgi:hypothetical protein